MIDTNIKGLLYISRLISPKMIERGSGHIINISSIAGKETYPFGNVYCATKHAVQSLTKGMRIDLLKYGIKVSSVSPGAVETEFALVRFEGDKDKARQVYRGFTPLYAQDIAETILFIVTRPKHVNIDDVLIMPTDQAFSRDFNRREID
jgi:NADP-dependent 3-hydroxy acid dehydrogenase YdfG